MKKRSFHFTPFQILVHLASWVPLLWLVWDSYAGHLSVDPVQDLTRRTGKYALIWLLLSLSVTPANTLFGFRQAIKVRRAVGLYAFFYAAIHLTIFLWLDFGLDFKLIVNEVIEKRYILVGLSALAILTALAATSTRSWMKRLGKNWKRLHKLIYLAGPLVILHYTWAKKGDLLRLQGEVLQPLAFGLFLALLLIVRIPAVRRWASGLRLRLQAQVASLGKSRSQRTVA